MGKKKKALLRYKRLGTISKKLERKFANFLQANLDNFTTKVEEALEKVDEILDKTEVFISDTKEEEVEVNTTPEPVVEDKPKTTRKRKPAAKKTTTSTTRTRRTTKTKEEA
jgi:hypothetical protein